MNEKGFPDIGYIHFCSSRLFLSSISSPFLGFLVVRSLWWNWPNTRVVERRASNKVDCSFMAFCAEVLRADCSRWSLQLRMWQWNDLTSYRQSGFGGLDGLSVPLNYEYMALDCATFKIISWWFVEQDYLTNSAFISKVRHPLTLKNQHCFDCHIQPQPNESHVRGCARAK